MCVHYLAQCIFNLLFSIFHFQFISRTEAAEYAKAFVTSHFRLHASYVKKRTQPASAGRVRFYGYED